MVILLDSICGYAGSIQVRFEVCWRSCAEFNSGRKAKKPQWKLKFFISEIFCLEGAREKYPDKMIINSL